MGIPPLSSSPPSRAIMGYHDTGGHIMAAVLLIPFLSLRIGAITLLDSSALRRAAYFPVPRVRKACLLALSALQRRPAAGPFLRVGPYCARPSSGAERPSTHSACSFSCSPSSASRPLGERAPQGRLPHLPQSHVCLLFFVFLGCVLSRSRYRFWPPSSSFSSPPTPSSGPRSAGAARPSARPTSATAARSDATYK